MDLRHRCLFVEVWLVFIASRTQGSAGLNHSSVYGGTRMLDEYTHAPLPSAAPLPSPSRGCTPLKCFEPLTFAPRGSPCGCVLPIQVRLQFNLTMYKLFPLLSELSHEIAAAIPLNRTQVRILGLNATGVKLQKVTVDISLVPAEAMFTPSIAFSIYTKFWRRDVITNTSSFGAYEMLYVQYPGLPPSPPPEKQGSSDISCSIRKNCSRKLIIITVVSSVAAFAVCTGFILMCSSTFSRLRRGSQFRITNKASGDGIGRNEATRSCHNSGSMTNRSFLACAGSAKIFSLEDIKKATNNFDDSRIIGEGGFGLVYEGVVENGRKVAVKVLKREDQGTREFLSELDILGRLHHKNLVRLIGICAEEVCRGLVYELVPNGSLESHLHGADKEVDSLVWCARLKIAVGAAKGLAYMHEDSTPPVIHRDFKASNILLEEDYTPKISDFGSAVEQGSKITRVTGTFGYFAPEYAMNGDLLVKSDVYSFGVVLLELLTGRMPVDFSQPFGQENLVSWARPLLMTNEGIESMVDPFIRQSVPLDQFSRVAEIARMCVQPQVSDRPSMGEVAQALKLVWDEFSDGRRIPISGTCSQGEVSLGTESKCSGGLSTEEALDIWVSSKFSVVTTQDSESISASFWRHKSPSLRELNPAVQRLWKQGKLGPNFRGSGRSS